MIIDCHAHLLPPERMAKLIRWSRRFNPDHPVPESLLPRRATVFAGFSRSWEPRAEQAAAWAELRRGLEAFADRVMFGTDHPSGAGTIEEIYREFHEFGLPAEVPQALLGGTALRLMARLRRVQPLAGV